MGWNLGILIVNCLLISFFMFVWSEGRGRDREVVPFLLLGNAIISGIVQLRLLHKAWSVIQDSQTSMTPGKAVGYLFIPFVNLGWVWRAYMGFVDQYNKYIERRGLNVTRQGSAAYLMFCLLFWSFLVVSRIPKIEPVALIFGLQQFICLPILVASLVSAINRVTRAIPYGSPAIAVAGGVR